MNDWWSKSHGLWVVPHPHQDAFLMSPSVLLSVAPQASPLVVRPASDLGREVEETLMSKCLQEAPSDYQSMELLEGPLICICPSQCLALSSLAFLGGHSGPMRRAPDNLLYLVSL